MYCKEHDTSIATLQCSVCGEHFCDLCNNGSEPFVCTSCATKSDINLNQDTQNLADDILNDILSNIDLPENTKISFDPSDILAQIEAGLTASEANDTIEKLNDITSSDINELNVVETLVTETLENEDLATADLVTENLATEDLVTADLVTENLISEDSVNEDSVNETDASAIDNTEEISAAEVASTVVLTKEVVDNVSDSKDNIIEPTEQKTSMFSAFKTKFTETKDVAKDKINNMDMTGTKEKAAQLSGETKEKASQLSEEAKVKASKLSGEAKVKTAAATAYTVEKAKQAKTYANEKITTNKTNLDDTISKIQEANVNGEYDDLLSKFSTHYGQGAKEAENDSQFALPLKINNFLYFLCSLVPGIAQLYLGLTKRGATLLLIASVFLFVTMTPSLYFITSILSFADAYKLRNIYYRGGVIEDCNKDIVTFITNKYVILVIIATVVINLIRYIF